MGQHEHPVPLGRCHAVLNCCSNERNCLGLRAGVPRLETWASSANAFLAGQGLRLSSRATTARRSFRAASGAFQRAQMPHTVSTCGPSSSHSSSPWSGSCSPSSSASSSLVRMGSGCFNLVRPSRERSPVNSTAVGSFHFARGADQIAWSGNVEYNPEFEKFERKDR